MLLLPKLASLSRDANCKTRRWFRCIGFGRRQEGLIHELVGERGVPEPHAGAPRPAPAGACASWLASRVVAFPLCLYVADDGLRGGRPRGSYCGAGGAAIGLVTAERRPLHHGRPWPW